MASLGLAAAVAGTCIALGVPLAWLLTRTAIPGGRLWLIVAALPLAVPSYVAAYTWLAAFPWLQGFAPAWAVLSLVRAFRMWSFRWLPCCPRSTRIR